MPNRPIVTSLSTGLILTAALTQSCTNEGLTECSNYLTPLEVENHWVLAPDAQPEGMACCFFPANGDAPWRFDFAGRDGGEVKIPISDYAFITYNDDTQRILFEQENSYTGLTATTLPASLTDGSDSDDAESSGQQPARATSPGEAVTLSPDMLWSCAIPEVKLGWQEITYIDTDGGSNPYVHSDLMLLPTHPAPVVCHYRFTIEDVVGLDGVAHMSASLSGMASGVNLSTQRRSATAVTHPCDAAPSSENYVEGNLLTFGRPEGAEAKCVLSLYVWLTDGQRLSYEFDVTDQADSAPDPMNVWLRLTGLTLPAPGDAGGAFNVTVDAWKTIVINIGD